jgi:hypothetical protein
MGQGRMRNVNLEFAVFNVRAIPQRIGLVGEAGWRAEIRDVPFLVRRHAAGHVVQLGKVVRPEILVKVQIAVVALGGLAVCAQEIERGDVGRCDRVARQRDARNLLTNDVM